MKPVIVALSFAVLLASLTPFTAEAKRFGGGSSAGMQRSVPTRPMSPATPPTAVPSPAQAAPTAPALGGAAAAAAAPKRSWLGPIAGLAAGLGIAALMSHMGMGEGMGNIVMLVLLGFVAFAAIRFLMNRFGSRGAPSMATPNGNYGFAGGPSPQSMNAPSSATTSPSWTPVMPAAAAAPLADAASAGTLPAGFDAAGFERIAKMIFIRMQAANDVADLNDLRGFTTPEMFASIKLDLQDRGSATQTTDVVRIDAQVLDVATEAARQIVSVRFHGLIREEKDGAAEPFDEIWHLTRPLDASREWAIAGIQQAQSH